MNQQDAKRHELKAADLLRESEEVYGRGFVRVAAALAQQSQAHSLLAKMPPRAS